MTKDDTHHQDIMARFKPVPGADVEATLGRHIAMRTWWVTPLLAAIFWLFSGPEGALAAAVGSLIVAINFVVAGWLLSKSARISLSLYHAAAFIGFVVRLGLITLAIILVGRATNIDRLAMGVAAVVSYLVLLSLEAVAVVKGKEKELEWS